MKVTLVGTTILLRPELEKAFHPIDAMDLQRYSQILKIDRILIYVNIVLR